MASPPEPDVRPLQSAAGPAPPGSDSPAIAWPLVERRQPRARARSGPDRRSTEAVHGATSRFPQSAAPPLAPFRWVAIGVGLIIAYPDLSRTSYRLLFGALVLIAYAAYRSWRPIPYADDRSTVAPMLF